MSVEKLAEMESPLKEKHGFKDGFPYLCLDVLPFAQGFAG